MNLNNQVCSLEFAKRLKELGVKQKSYFKWETNNADHAELFHSKATSCCHDYYSAFTVAELLIILPMRITLPQGEPFNSFRFRMEKGIWSNGDCCDTSKLKFTEFYSVNYYCDTTSQELDWLFKSLASHFSDENPANALAKALIYLIENKLI